MRILRLDSNLFLNRIFSLLAKKWKKQTQIHSHFYLCKFLNAFIEFMISSYVSF